MSEDFYFTIEKPSSAEFKDRGSKFIAYAFPIESADDFKTQLQRLKKEHPKAVHHCFAYRIGTDGNSFRSGDDGEPSGTAGKPILGQIDSKGITNAAVIVVRYWGGTLLGVPGLINAYKTATALALQVTPVIQKQVEVVHTIEFDYTRMNEVMMIIKQYNCTVISKEMQLFCVMKAGIPKNRLEEVLYKLKDLQNVVVKKCG
ncbi:MAG: IMPACT family protein [Ferruginibacter sp.]|nr:YigZ family protein [Chitinophagaceae bacterium]MBP6286179.1 YigZ family protein [Ferruginibacter sp.]MBU9935227.1 IMPACT family protein [Ferruginibacter sp.]